MEPLTVQNASEIELNQREELSKLSLEERQKVDDLVRQINVFDSQLVIQYGTPAQSKISTFADNVLSNIKAKDSGYVGDVLTDLMFKVKELNVDNLAEGDSFLSRIPIIGSFVKSTKKFIAQYEELSIQIEKIVNELERTQIQLLKDIAMMDNLYVKNLDYLRELNFYIMAGKLKLAEINEKVIPELKERALNSQEQMDAQKLNDMIQMANRFEKKIHDLQLSKMIAIQTAPQIRLIQNNDQLLVEKIQSSILNTIPLWKNQIIIAIGLAKQKKAVEMQKEVTKTTNDLLTKNAEMLKSNSIEVAKETERGIVDIETLKKVNSDLITTIEEIVKIQEEGKAKRRLAEQEIGKMEDDLKQKLIEMR